MLTIVIPMAGDGSRFREAGYDVPKPLIDIHGYCMVERVISNIADQYDRVILIAREEHRDALINSPLWHKKNILFRFLGEKTEGTACTILKVAKLINNNDPLLIANSDQFIKYDRAAWLRHIDLADASIMTFRASDPKYSYVRLDQDGFVAEVAEKRVISELATCGVYYFKRGSDFCEAANRMIANDLRVNGEFYTCPVFNELPMHFTTSIFPVEEMLGLGTPKDLEDNRDRVLELEILMQSEQGVKVITPAKVYLHRANTLKAIRRAVRNGWGVEIDIRSQGGALFLSHDPVFTEASAPRLLEVLAVLEETNTPVILDLKETGLMPLLQNELVGDFSRYVATDLIVPDMIDYEAAGLRTLARRTDSHSMSEAVEGPFYGYWFDYVDGAGVLGLTVSPHAYLVSPELHGWDLTAEFINNAVRHDWEGVCTDQPERWKSAITRGFQP